MKNLIIDFLLLAITLIFAVRFQKYLQDGFPKKKWEKVISKIQEGSLDKWCKFVNLKRLALLCIKYRAMIYFIILAFVSIRIAYDKDKKEYIVKELQEAVRLEYRDSTANVHNLDKVIFIYNELLKEKILSIEQKIRIYDGLGDIHERLAYSGKQRACEFHLSSDENGKIFFSRTYVDAGTIIGTNDFRYDTIIHCTYPEYKSHWQTAYDNFEQCYRLLLKNPDCYERSTSFTIDVIHYYKNISYFFLCDYLQNGEIKSLDMAKECAEQSIAIMRKANVYTSYKNLDTKIKLIKFLYENEWLKCECLN